MNGPTSHWQPTQPHTPPAANTDMHRVAEALYAQWTNARARIPGAIARHRDVGYWRGVASGALETAFALGIVKDANGWHDREKREYAARGTTVPAIPTSTLDRPREARSEAARAANVINAEFVAR